MIQTLQWRFCFYQDEDASAKKNCNSRYLKPKLPKMVIQNSMYCIFLNFKHLLNLFLASKVSIPLHKLVIDMLFCFLFFIQLSSCVSSSVQWQWTIHQRSLFVLQWLERARVWHTHQPVYWSVMRRPWFLHWRELCLLCRIQRRKLWGR